MIDNGNEQKDMKKKWVILSIIITIFLRDGETIILEQKAYTRNVINRYDFVTYERYI